MQKNNFYISFGVWIFILPFLGIPTAWKNILIVLSGMFLIIVVAGPTVLKKLQTKPRIKRKSKIDSQENIQVEPKFENINLKNLDNNENSLKFNNEQKQNTEETDKVI